MNATTKLRIAMVVPPWFEVPPEGYGGIEWMAYWLTEGLVRRGHEVTLIAAGRNRTSAKFLRTFDVPPSLRLGEPLPELIHAAMTSKFLRSHEFDVIHDHTLAGPAFASTRESPTVVTAHGPMDAEIAQYYRLLADQMRLVAISDMQRFHAPDLPWIAMVHNGVPVEHYPFRENKEDFALFLGRMNPQKGAHLAIDAAKAARLPIVVAAKCNEPLEFEYFEREVKPRLGKGVEWVGEVDTRKKKDLLSRARCLVFPVQWEEPFGIVMVESMACGTPVVALNRGSVAEVIDHGRTGLIAHDPSELPDLIIKSSDLKATACRERALQRFDVEQMVSGYERAYQGALESPPVATPTLELEDAALEPSA